MVFIELAKTEIQQLQCFVATQKVVDYFKLLNVIRNGILGHPNLGNFIVSFKAVHQLIEALSGYLVGMNIKFPELHLLLLIKLNEV